ncbi:MAG: hypothetical protein ACRYFZ_28140 [Janthinobacterium lividum]
MTPRSAHLPAYNPIEHLPLPVDSQPTLRVVHQGRGYQGQCRVYLSTALAQYLNLRPNQPIDLIAPATGSPYWHLDLRPQAKRRINWYTDTRPRITSLALPDGLVMAGRPLTLELRLGESAIPGIYTLQPTHAQSAAQ